MAYKILMSVTLEDAADVEAVASSLLDVEGVKSVTRPVPLSLTAGTIISFGGGSYRLRHDATADSVTETSGL